MAFSGKMWRMITLKKNKKTGPHPFFKKYIFGRVSNWTPPAFLGLKL